jgi:hypothetical protein
MPMHEWTRVEAGIYHAFHHGWIHEIARALNQGLLPRDYYALPEQVAAGYAPDVLTLQEQRPEEEEPNGGGVATAAALQTRPRTRVMVESSFSFSPRMKSAIAVRHVSDDRLVAWVEIVSSGNKAARRPFREFINKSCELLERRIHLLIIDPLPPGPRDPNGVHAAIWQELQEDAFELPPHKPLTLVAYECELLTRAYVEPVAGGDLLPNMPLFLEPGGCIMVPLEATYQTAYAVLPRRWQRVLDAPSS